MFCGFFLVVKRNWNKLQAEFGSEQGSGFCRGAAFIRKCICNEKDVCISVGIGLHVGCFCSETVRSPFLWN